MPTFGATAAGTAGGGYIQESSDETTIEVATIKGPDGNVVVARAKPRSVKTQTTKTKGEAGIVTTASKGGFTSGITSCKVSQTNDDYPTVEVTTTTYA